MKQHVRGDEPSHISSTVGACIEGRILASGGNGELAGQGVMRGRLVQAAVVVVLLKEDPVTARSSRVSTGACAPRGRALATCERSRAAQG